MGLEALSHNPSKLYAWWDQAALRNGFHLIHTTLEPRFILVNIAFNVIKRHKSYI